MAKIYRASPLSPPLGNEARGSPPQNIICVDGAAVEHVHWADACGRCVPRVFERQSKLDAPVAINEEARRYWLESPHQAAIVYARLDVDVVVGGFE